MTKIIVDITVSLDGYVTGPNPGPANGLGDNGEALHHWAVNSDDPREAQLLEATVARTGAIVMGRNLFDVVDGPNGWSENGGYGAGKAPARRPPAFVVTHSRPARVRLPGMRICTDGLDDALDQAVAAAGSLDVFVMGGGDICHQAVHSGRADELRLHLAPIVLGGGTRLFRDGGDLATFEQLEPVVTDHAIHARYVPR